MKGFWIEAGLSLKQLIRQRKTHCALTSVFETNHQTVIILRWVAEVDHSYWAVVSTEVHWDVLDRNEYILMTVLLIAWWVETTCAHFRKSCCD